MLNERINECIDDWTLFVLFLCHVRSCGACAGSGGPRADVQEAGGQDGGGDALQGPGHQ